MDQPNYTTLMEALQDVPDPRQARGKRYAWPFLLALAASVIASGQRTGRALAHWVTLHTAGLLEQLRPPRHHLPGESTVRRVLRAIDLQTLEEGLSRYTESLAAQAADAGAIRMPTGEMLQGQAVDGRDVWPHQPATGASGRCTNRKAVAWALDD